MFFEVICLRRLNILTIKLCGTYNLSFETKVAVYHDSAPAFITAFPH